MTVSLAGLASAARHLDERTSLRPERSFEGVKPQRAWLQPRPAETPGALSHLAALSLEQSAPFLIQQLLAAAPELNAARPSRRATLAAYEAHLARRIQYSGPLTPVDLRI